jgi:HD-like signal output (HDOD) protein
MDTAVAITPQSATDTDVVSDDAAQLIKNIGIPPCPAVLVEFMAETRKDEPDFRRLSHLINKDVALAAAVLKTVNSPFYGLGKQARTVQEALTLLGLRQAARLVADLMLRQAFASSQLPAMHEFWDSSAKIALVTGYLARELGSAKLDEAHTFALFRDCGVAILLIRYPEYAELLATTRNDNERQRSEIERSRYGFDHASVGATLAQSWHLPAEAWQAIAAHNTYAQPMFAQQPNSARFAPLIALALLAEQLHRTNCGTFDSAAWTTEQAFIEQILGPLQDRLEPLGNDIARLLQKT